MLKALEAARTKLDIYYSDTDYVPGQIYAINTMLSPGNKFQFFMTRDWDNKWREIYRKAIQEQLVPYQEHIIAEEASLSSMRSAKTVLRGSKLDEMLNGSKDQPF